RYSRVLPPLPVITRTNLAPSFCALRKNEDSAAWASLWVLPCRSTRKSIASVPRASRCLSRRSNGSRGAVGLATGGAERAGGREGGGGGEGCGLGVPGAVGGSGSGGSGCRRSGATERVTSLQSFCSCALSPRRDGLPSPALMIAAAIAPAQPAGAIFLPGSRSHSCPPHAWTCSAPA